MRILMLSHEYPPVGGGAGASCALVAEQYAGAGHDVTVLTMALADLPAAEVVNGVRILRQACGRERWEMASPAEGLIWARRAWTAAWQLHQQRPFDVSHAHFIMPAGIIARWLQTRAGVPYVITPRGSDVPGYNSERLKLAHILARPWWKRIVRHAACIISPSQSLLDLIRVRVPGVRSIVVPNGINASRFESGHKQHRILLCSRLVERKGFQYFLQGIREVDLPGWHVDLVGSGPFQAALAKLAAQCKVAVTMHGRIDNRDSRLSDLYAQAALFVFPSERENCPVAILEGMAAGCAVITTNVTGNPEVLGNAGCLVPPRDPEALRDATLSLIADVPRRVALARAAQQRVREGFAPSLVAARNLDVLRAAMKHREGAP